MALGVVAQVINVEVLGLAFSLAILIPSIAIGVRRLHDINKSGWWILISIIPILGFIVLLIFYIKEGDAGANQYGPSSVSGAAPAAPDMQAGSDMGQTQQPAPEVQTPEENQQ